jgi:hypothetical protein
MALSQDLRSKLAAFNKKPTRKKNHVVRQKVHAYGWNHGWMRQPHPQVAILKMKMLK